MARIMVKTGDLFASKAQTLVNTVNCVGVMGKGIALEFKARFADMYKDYVQRCQTGEVKLGQPYLYKQLVGPWILNFPTKDHWRSVARLADIVEGLKYLELHYKEWGIKSLAVPALGTGSGQLEWNIVGPTLYRHLSQLDIAVELFAPHDTPLEQLGKAFLEQDITRAVALGRDLDPSRISPAAVALVGILSRINREPYHWPIGRIAFQKIAYFATETGIPTRLHYQRGSYGPFAPELKPLITRLVNHGLVAETQQGPMFVYKLGPTYRDAREVCKPQLREWVPAIERIADLFLRLPRTIDAEIAATVHFAATKLASTGAGRPSERDVLDEVKRWKLKRRPPIRDKDVATTIRNLNSLGWVELKASPELLPTDEEVLVA